MMDEKETLGLADMFELFASAVFVKDYGAQIAEDGQRLFTAKAEVFVPALGKVTIYSTLYPRFTFAIPVLLITEEQKTILRKNEIYFPLRRRVNPRDDKIYIGIPSKEALEKIEKL